MSTLPYSWYGDQPKLEEGYKPLNADKKCECGTSITMGAKDDHPMFHSDWCPLYKKELKCPLTSQPESW